MQIGNNLIGEGHPCFIIAEAGLNHNGMPEMAAQLIESAADCGADAVKFQTYLTHELFAPDHPEYDKFERMQLSRDVYNDLRKIADQCGIVLLSTPFDEISVDLLYELGVPAFKIGSGELTHLDFLRFAASKKKPMVLSTGMSTPSQVDAAVAVLQEAAAEFALLHCVSSYPCPPELARIRSVSSLREKYSVPIGYSDHTTGVEAALAAVALGACIIEKHFTLSKNLPGWDHFFSTDPDELKRLVASVRVTESVLGSAEKIVQDAERPIESIARRALYARRRLKAGEVLTRNDVLVRRPLGPISAEKLDDYVGRALTCDVGSQCAFKPGDFQ
ncbi:MAG: N-acetylneuraminate synthase family protein [Candidatus Hinthialibacter antarcticus]|nr:N-acetylneuraminate synthase family protein [Candidatus Hinthialibacter antarcticus]